MLVLVLLILWPIAELVVIVKLAEAIGVLLTLALLVASWPLGTLVIRLQARSLWRRAVRTLAMGQVPGRPAVDAALGMLAGLLFLIPGFLTDALALLLLLPPVRALCRGALARHRQSRLVQRAARFAERSPAYDAEATAHDFEPPSLPS